MLFALEKGEKREKLGECEATIKRRTDRPFKSKNMVKNMAKVTAMTLKRELKIRTAQNKISKESIEAHAHKSLKH